MRKKQLHSLTKIFYAFLLTTGSFLSSSLQINTPVLASTNQTLPKDQIASLDAVKQIGQSRAEKSPHSQQEVQMLQNDLKDGGFHSERAHSSSTNHKINMGDSPVTGTGPLHLSTSSGQVMQTNNIYAIYWLPSSGKLQDGTTSTSFTSGYSNFENQFLTDFSSTSIANIATQYYDNTNGHINQYAPYLQGSYIDTRSYPSPSDTGLCSDSPNGTNCITNNNIANEILWVLQQSVNSSWGVGGLNNEYIVYTSSNENTCFKDQGNNPNCSYSNSAIIANAYCGYHDFYHDNGTGKNFLFATINYVDNSSCPDSSYNSPNNNIAEDFAASVASHEIMETETDPLINAWTDSTNSVEMGDMCADDWTGISVFNGSTYDDYEIQKEYSNYIQDDGTRQECTDTIPNNGIVNGTVYQTKTVTTGSYPNQTTTTSIVAMNTNDGSTRWGSASISGGYSTTRTNSHQVVQSDPVLDTTNGLLYIEVYDVYAGHTDLLSINATTGAVAHDYSVTNLNVYTRPILDSSNNLYVFGNDNKIYCYTSSGTCGASNWPYTTTISSIIPQFTIDSGNNILYYGSDDGNLYGIYDQKATNPGTLYMSFYNSYYGKIDAAYAPAVASSGTIYFGTKGGSLYSPTYYVLSCTISSSTCSLNWHKQVNSDVYQLAIGATGILYAPTQYTGSLGGLYVLKTSDGTNQWSSNDPSGSTATVSTSNNYVYYTGTSGNLFSYGQSNGTLNFNKNAYSSTYYVPVVDTINTGSSYLDELFCYANIYTSSTTHLAADYSLNSSGNVRYSWTSTNLDPVLVLSLYYF